MKNITLPTTIEELQNTLKIAIENFQVSPVKNQNKLNECTALALGFQNYDHLSAAIKNKSAEPKYDVRLWNGEMIINGVKINSEVFDEEHVVYQLQTVGQLTDNLIQIISEAQTMYSKKDMQAQIIMMKNDLKELLSWDDELAFSSILTNEYIAQSDTDNFNQVCDDILTAHKAIEYRDHKIFNND